MKIQEHVPLKEKNWFHVGGDARYYCEPQSVEDFKEAFQFSKNKNIPFFILGEGANIVISDDGFDGLVIHPKNNNMSFTENNNVCDVTVGAGASMHNLIEYTLDNNILGLEIFSNIPGTIGGSVYINLHYFEALISQILTKATVIHVTTGEVITVDNRWFEFGYDQSKLMEKEYILIDATLQLKKGTDTEIAYARGRRFEITRHRTSRYPKAYTCGSFFRNFSDDEVSFMWEGKKMKFVAFYLDKIGVKGVEFVGGACVSSQHANMIINKSNATASDIVQLARILQQKVKDAFDVIPQPECIFVGFKEYPLL